jgi:hypothetical protein
LAGIRIYVFSHQPQYQEFLSGDWNWFDTATMIFWPGAFFLRVMQGEEPVKVAIVVWGIAVLANPLLFGESLRLAIRPWHKFTARRSFLVSGSCVVQKSRNRD